MHLPCKICFGLFQQLADHVHLAGKYTALKKTMRGNLEMYSIIMKADLPVPPTEQSNVNILNELHLLPHVAKKKRKKYF